MSAMPTTTTLGLIEAFDRHGALLARCLLYTSDAADE